jgi:hypothetical protein
VGELCQACLLELFANPDSTLAGTVFLTDTNTLPITVTLPSGFAFLADTVTNEEGTTSEFAPVPDCPDIHPVYLPIILK